MRLKKYVFILSEFNNLYVGNMKPNSINISYCPNEYYFILAVWNQKNNEFILATCNCFHFDNVKINNINIPYCRNEIYFISATLLHICFNFILPKWKIIILAIWNVITSTFHTVKTIFFHFCNIIWIVFWFYIAKI